MYSYENEQQPPIKAAAAVDAQIVFFTQRHTRVKTPWCSAAARRTLALAVIFATTRRTRSKVHDEHRLVVYRSNITHYNGCFIILAFQIVYISE